MISGLRREDIGLRDVPLNLAFAPLEHATQRTRIDTASAMQTVEVFAVMSWRSLRFKVSTKGKQYV